MKATLLLADFAKVANGKLDIMGGGWSMTGPGPFAFVVAGVVQIPWDQTNMRHVIRLELLDADGQVVEHEQSAQPIHAEMQVEVGRPAGLKAGTPLDFPFVVPFGPLSLTPGGRYEVRTTINGESHDAWSLPFSVRQQGQQPPAPQ